jgi:hypothetical protein
MIKMQWKQELIFVKRDANGVIVALSEQTPKDYADPNKRLEAQAAKYSRMIQKRFWPVEK